MSLKQLFYSLTAIMLMLSFQACPNDDEDEQEEDIKTNVMSYQGAKYKIIEHDVDFYAEYGEGKSSSGLLYFFGEGLTVDIESKRLEGSGLVFSFSVISSSPKLGAGDYTFQRPQDQIDFTKNTFKNVALRLVVNNNWGESIVDFNNSESKITINKIGEEHEFIIKGVAQDGKTINIYYKGKLRIIYNPPV